MVLHSMTILRCWSQLAWVTKAGLPSPRTASIRGFDADRAAFIAAMHTASTPWADDLVAKLGPPKFSHLLDVGGASGTWTLAFLRAAPQAKATIFDLPDAIDQARERLAKSEFSGRVSLVKGDFYADELPAGVDYAWVSAICHQHSRQHNRELFAKVYRALAPGGRIALRDIVMQPDRTQPRDGAMFAINMLVNTPTGGTFTFEEYAADLQSAGFRDPQLLVQHEGMNAVVGARKA
jgi:ubiquinone/menaquinone biosynthesis C-methylase UbiE